MDISRNQYLERLIAKKENGRVKVITGIRRCGKSYLLFELFTKYLLSNEVEEDQIIGLALDELPNAKYRNPIELDRYIRERIVDQKKQYYVLIDEIQFVSEVQNPYVEDANAKLTFIDVVLGLVKIKNADIYVTGSNSKMLSSDILTQFRDRGDEIRVFPLSFAEFYAAYTEDKRYAWGDYCTYGGMPLAFSLSSHEEKSKYLLDLFTKTYLRDVVERYQIQNDVAVLEDLLNIVSSAIGSLTNPHKLSNTFASEKRIRIAPDTIETYLGYFTDAFLLQKASRYDVKGKRYMKTPLKYYFTDVGLRNARLGFRQQEETHLMENIIYNTLLYRDCAVDVGIVEITETKDNKRTKKQHEIDFVVNRGAKKYYIQSALSIEDPDKRTSELRPLKSTGDFFKKIIVTKTSMRPWTDDDGIFHVGLYEFLLNPNALDL